MESHNLSHCDIKPLNILLDKCMKPILCDFGLCSKIEEKNPRIECKGSLAYLAPEILRKEIYDPKISDVWSFGVTTFQCLTSMLPFYANSPTGIYKMITNTSPHTYFSHCEEISKLLKNCLDIDPLKRWTMNEVYNYIVEIECVNQKNSIGLKNCKRSLTMPPIITLRASKKMQNLRKKLKKSFSLISNPNIFCTFFNNIFKKKNFYLFFYIYFFFFNLKKKKKKKEKYNLVFLKKSFDHYSLKKC